MFSFSSSREEGEMEEKVAEVSTVKSNGGPLPLGNGYHHDNNIVCPEMCYYCFDVLVAHLTRSPSPRSPHFINDE